MATKPIVNIHQNDPPAWFKTADLGIFIHWGLYSVPAYAPVAGGHGEHQKGAFRDMFAQQPYAEWYANSIRIDGSLAYQYHRRHYRGQPYEAFAETFKKTAQNVDIPRWVDLFVKAGAKYVVLVSKHHDGFVMFNSRQENPHLADYHLDWDFVGELAAECRRRGLRFGVYYSSLLDWTFTRRAVESPADMLVGNNNSQEYMDYAYHHWREIIDRWGQYPNSLRNPAGRALFNVGARIVMNRPAKAGALGPDKYWDYRTAEYTLDWPADDIWFEMCRGMDKSFGYNKNSRPQDYITAAEVRRIISVLTPKKGRLLLNVGPDENGAIPSYQERIFQELAETRG